MEQLIVQIAYFAAATLFILSLKWMNSPATARRGVMAASVGMLAAVIGTLLRFDVVDYQLILVGLVLGVVIGVPIAYLTPLTAVPQRTAIAQSCGALATGLIGTAEYYRHTPHGFTMFAITVESLLGFLTLTAALMAFGKLQEILPTRPLTYKGQNIVSFFVLAVAVVLAVWVNIQPEQTWIFPIFAVLAMAFGVMLILPIGGADMPTVIALLNSYAGLAACAMGFALGNRLLIIAGALDGASGFVLSIIMCKAMNRSFSNVLFGAFGQVQSGAAKVEQKPVRSMDAEAAAEILASSRLVIIIPGYGLAVAQAQHKVREMFDILTKKGVDVRFAIHPVAGRMPGHMNVLLAEVDIPYDKLVEMDEINGDFPQCDVALVIGANDVVNPAARTDPQSPIAGMPILNADQARTVMIIKRGMSPGFAGIDNELYYMDKTLMLFGDAKAFVGNIVKSLSGSGGH